jgi:ATP-binding cassette subfamily C protein
MPVEMPDIAHFLVLLHWTGMIIGLGTAGAADVIGLRLLLSRAAKPRGRALSVLHIVIAGAILLLMFSGTGIAVLRADLWCGLDPALVTSFSGLCVPNKLLVKLVLMLVLVGAAVCIDQFLLPLKARTERPLLPALSVFEIARAAVIVCASLTCWLSLATIPFARALHSWPPSSLLVAIAAVYVALVLGSSAALLTIRRMLAYEHNSKPTLHAERRPDPIAILPGRITFGGALAASASAFGGVVLISLLLNTLMLTGPLYMLQVYDRVLTSRSIPTLVMLSVLMVGLYLFATAFDLLRARIMTRIALGLDHRLAPALFSRAVAAQALARRSTQPSPVRDLDQIRQFVAGPAAVALIDAPWAPIYLVLVFLLHPLLGGLVVGGSVILVATALISQILSARRMTEVTRLGSQSEALVEASVRKADVHRALGMGDALRQRWLDLHVRSLAVQSAAGDTAGAAGAVTRGSRMLLQSILLGAGAYLALHDAMSAGAMVATSIIAARALAPVEQIVGQWRSLALVVGAIGRCRTALSEQPPEHAHIALPPPEGHLAVKSLYVAPHGANEMTLKGLTFDIGPGDCLAVVGPSGAGKSTLVKALVGAWPGRHGEIRLDGALLDHRSPEDLGRHIGYLPQECDLFDATIAENIARLAREVDPKAVVAAAQAAGVHEAVLRLENGYATRVGDGGSALSGGQRQRIALARALYGDPALIVMDEPNANLDTEGEEALAQAIARLRDARRTIVVVSHRKAILAVASHVLVLKDGKQAAFGPPAKIVRIPTAGKPENRNDPVRSIRRADLRPVTV